MKSYDDPAKRLSREKFREFILKHLIFDAGLKSKDIKVVCLETPEALEIKEVYDRLGIPRINITVIECDPEIAAKIRAQDLGVKVVTSLDSKYFATSKEGPFHIISLDYKSQKNSMIIYSIRNITGNNLLHYPGIILVNNFASRETESRRMQISAFDLLVSPDQPLSGRSYLENRMLNISSKATFLESLSDTSELDFGSIRDDFTRAILYTLNSGNYGTKFLSENFVGDPDFIYKFYPHSLELEEQTLKFALEKGIDKFEVIFRLPLFHIARMTEYVGDLVNAVDDQGLRDLVYLALYECWINAPLILGLERYKYVSRFGSPMHIDFFYLSSFPNKLRGQLVRMFEVKNGYQGERVLRKSKKFDPRRLNKLVWQYFAIKKKEGHFTSSSLLPERIFLGSSTKMLKEQNDQDAST
jgi:hypothetical protein